MQVDPDSVEVKIPWGNAPWSWRLAGASFIGLAVVNAAMDLGDRSDATVIGVLAAGIAGAAWAVLIRLVDRWWDGRPGMHVVTEDLEHEVKRQAPSVLVWIAGVFLFYAFGGGGGGLYGVTALFAMIGTELMLVMPGHARRRYVRRNLRAGLIPPPAPAP